ncbi:MAG: hypothetical protein ACKVT0_07980 [Planctomycetaceae bacterium]
MNKVQAIENEVQRLTCDELAAFREWFQEFDNQAWDEQIEKDAKSGKLESMSAKSLAAHRRGESREL